MRSLTLTFFGFPKTTPQNVTKSTIAIVGSTCTSKSIHPTLDQERATKILRQLSHEYDTHDLHLETPLENYDIVDLGDFNCKDLGRVLKELWANEAKIVVIGGDHSTTYFSLRAIQSISRIAIFDAHLDSENTDNLHHGSFVYKILHEKEDMKIYSVGLRGYSTMREELSFAQQRFNVLPWPTSPELIKFVLKNFKFVSLDLDFFSPYSFRHCL